jgi:hypothetical protein
METCYTSDAEFHDPIVSVKGREDVGVSLKMQ